MAKYHISPKTGKVGRCIAKKKCKFSENGEEIAHYATKKEAIEASTAHLETFPTLQKEKNDNKVINIQGKIEAHTLDRESYKKFGFTEWSNDEYPDGLSTEEEWKQSKKECENLNEETIEAIKGYSDRYTEWFNEKVYSQEYKNDEKLSHQVNLIDEALNRKAEQRILYRGVSIDNAEKYSINNLQLGETVDFKGYQSTSTNPIIAGNFTNMDTHGILFEIITPQGINITSISSVSHESEVLLPRNSRYIVVGKQERMYSDVFGSFDKVQLIAVDDDGEILEDDKVSHKQ